MGRAAYPHTRRLLITADADGVQQLRHPRVEGRTRRLGAGNRARRHGVPHPAWHLQVEQDRRAPLREAPAERDEKTGEYRLLAGRWHTCFPDLYGGQRMIGQVQGRIAADAACWLALAPAAWRDAIQVVLHRHGHDLPVRGPQDAPEGTDRRGPDPRRTPSQQHRRRRAAARHPVQVRPPLPLRGPEYGIKNLLTLQPGGPDRRPVRQDHRHPRYRHRGTVRRTRCSARC